MTHPGFTEERLAAIRAGAWDEGWWQALARTVAVDFDGTIHPYTKGWTGSEPDDEPPIPGAVEFLEQLLADGFDIVIFSTRADHHDGEQGIIRWIHKHARPIFYAMRDDKRVRVSAQKPAAVAYVDDRAVPLRMPQESGSWEDSWADARAEVDRLANGRPHGAGQPADPPPGASHADCIPGGRCEVGPGRICNGTMATE